MLAKRSPNPTDKHVGARIRMRRLMLEMSQVRLGDALGLAFQQVQKYEKGTNRVGASRLQQIAHTLQVPVEFFFEGAPVTLGQKTNGKDAPSFEYVTNFISSADGLALVKGFTAIRDAKLRRRIVELVVQIAANA